ncbi:MAG: hypothetical protein L3J01_06095, partial [Thiomicrorhabdus sp.]|nr:hypothetical protein [Thiomicrorhabdus sp.]
VTDEAREKVFSALEKTLDPAVNTKVGRPGMELWKTFVLATLKLSTSGIAGGLFGYALKGLK